MSCNGTDNSFFRLETTGQIGVRVLRVSGHNMAQRTVNDTDRGVGRVTRTRTAEAKVSGPRPSDLGPGHTAAGFSIIIDNRIICSERQIIDYNR